MAKTKRKPGPKPRYPERRDYHLPLSIELADALETVAAKQAVREERRKSIIVTVEEALRRDPEIAAEIATQQRALGPVS